MTVVVNELEVIAPPQQQMGQEPIAALEEEPEPGPTARDIYWVMRTLASRRLRLKAD